MARTGRGLPRGRPRPTRARGRVAGWSAGGAGAPPRGAAGETGVSRTWQTQHTGRMNFRLERRGSMMFVVALVALYSWVAAGLRPFTLSQEALVAIPAVLALILAMRTPGTRRADTPDAPSRGSAAIWIGLVVLTAFWELNAYFSSPRSAHPTLSVIADDVMSVRPGRALVFFLWLALGYAFVRSSRAPRP